MIGSPVPPLRRWPRSRIICRGGGQLFPMSGSVLRTLALFGLGWGVARRRRGWLGHKRKPRRGDAGGSTVGGAQGGPHSVGSFACYRDDPATNLRGALLPISGPFDKEVFEQETTIARNKWAPAMDAGNFAVVCRRALYPDHLVRGFTVGTREGRDVRVQHMPIIAEFVAIWDSSRTQDATCPGNSLN